MRVVPDRGWGTLNMFSIPLTKNLYYSHDWRKKGLNDNRVVSANRLYASPFRPAYDLPIRNLGINVTTGVANAKARFGIYESNFRGEPSKLLRDCGEFDCASLGVKENEANYFILKASKLYWFAFVASHAITVSAGKGMPLGFHRIDGATSPYVIYHLYYSFTYAALPATFSSSYSFGSNFSATDWSPLVFFKAISGGYPVMGFVMNLTPQSVYSLGEWGYFGGGTASAGQTNEIDGLVFFSETLWNPSATLATTRIGTAAFNSPTRGYWAGGYSTANESEIDGIQFDTDTAINPSAGLGTARRYLAGVNSSTKGYAGGGNTGSVSNEIDGLQFSDESAINPAAILAAAREHLGAVNSSTKGYWGGGYTTTYSDEIDGIQFSDETAINPGAVLATARYYLAAVNSTTKGYFGGGYASTGRVTQIDGIQFSDETAIDPTAALSVARQCLAGCNSTTRGYWAGGYTTTYQNEIDGIEFSGETAINPSATLAVARQYVSGLQSGGIL